MTRTEKHWTRSRVLLNVRTPGRLVLASPPVSDWFLAFPRLLLSIVRVSQRDNGIRNWRFGGKEIPGYSVLFLFQCFQLPSGSFLCDPSSSLEERQSSRIAWIQLSSGLSSLLGLVLPPPTFLPPFVKKNTTTPFSYYTYYMALF